MQALLIIKPDAIIKSFDIIKYLTDKKIKIEAIKTEQLNEEQASALYKSHEDKYFYSALKNYMISGVSMLLVINVTTDELNTLKKDIRNQFKAFDWEKIIDEVMPLFSESSQKAASDITVLPKIIDEIKNTFDVVHCSDPEQEVANHEISLFFSDKNIINAYLTPKKMVEIAVNKVSAKLEHESKSEFKFF